MGLVTGNAPWEDFPSTNTPITADRLNRIETAIDGSMPGADDNYVTDAEKAALHTHPAVIAQGATAAAARTAIGAGTSDLAIGTTASTAKAGNYAPPAATATVQGVVELATPAEATTGTDTARAVTPQGLKAVADTKAPVTHSHVSTQITDWDEAVQDTVAAMLTSGANVSLTYDDAAGKITVTASGGDAELMRDTVGAALIGVNGVNVAVNDEADTITLSVTGVTIAQVTGLQAALDGKQTAGSYAAASHNHDERYATAAQGAKADSALQDATPQPINARTAAYTLVASDAGKLVTVTAAAGVTVTVPSGVFSAGQRVDVLDLGAGRVTFVAGAGMTLSGTPSLVSRARYSAHSVVFLSASQAVVVGDLA